MTKFPIDAVYCWTSDDPARRALRAEWLPKSDSCLLPDSATSSRIQDHDELRYSLRSLHRFAPWLRQIFLLISGQPPSWLRSGEKLRVVQDRACFPCSRDLPTFNSHAVECHVHRIEGLAEHFLYLNDDMFLGAPVRPRDFVHEDGTVRVATHPGWRSTPTGRPELQPNAYRAAWCNNNRLLDFRFGRQLRRHPLHQATMQRRSTTQRLLDDEMFAKAFAATSRSRFRSTSDIAPVGLSFYFGLHTGAARLRPVRQIFVRMTDDHHRLLGDLESIVKERPTFFCINDESQGKGRVLRGAMSSFLHSYLPRPSPFER